MTAVSSRPLPSGVREVSEAETTAGRAAPSEAEVRAAYRAETAHGIRRRLGGATLLFMVCVGAVSLGEQLYHPARSPTVWVVYAVYAVSWLAALTIARLPRFVPHTAWVAAALSATVSLTMSGYVRMVHAELELLTMGQICLLCGLSAMVPWGWRPQVLVAVVATAGVAAAAPGLVTILHPTICGITVATGTVTSLVGATILERLCIGEFTRSALLAHASAEHREEAEISSALFQVAQALHGSLEREDLVSHVNRVAVTAVGCDACYLYLRDQIRGTFRLHAHTGATPAALARIAEVEVAPDSRLIAALRPGTLCEVTDAEQQRLVPRSAMRLADCGAFLAVPVSRGEACIGMLVFAWRQRPSGFTRREHRLVFGIAHAATVALENVRLVAEITAASRLKSQFLSTMSHELRTPLNVISGYADILGEGGFGPLGAEQWRAVVGIRRSTRQLIELVEAGADLHRLEGGSGNMAADVVDLDELFSEVRRDLGAVDTTVVALRWKNALGRHPVTTDRAKLKTILKHVVGNALKFTAQGEVSVSVAEAPGKLIISVRDTGVGIAPDALSTIFEMFRQVDASETRRFGGIGLGLHIVHRLVQRLGGTVAVQSTPGRGSVFTIALPTSVESRAPVG